jgi:hypothetical protein
LRSEGLSRGRRPGGRRYGAANLVVGDTTAARLKHEIEIFRRLAQIYPDLYRERGRVLIDFVAGEKPAESDGGITGVAELDENFGDGNRNLTAGPEQRGRIDEPIHLAARTGCGILTAGSQHKDPQENLGNPHKTTPTARLTEARHEWS